MPLRLPAEAQDRDAAPGRATAPAAREARPAGRGVPFDGLTEEWRLVGRMDVEGGCPTRSTSARRSTIADVQWAPIDGSAPLVDGARARSVDPYDLILVLAGEGHAAELTDEERAAHKVHKISYDVALEAPPFRVIGTVYLYPGSRARAAARPGDRDVRAVVDAVALGINGRRSRTSTRSSSTASTCAASSRSTSGRARATRSCRARRSAASSWQDRS